MPITHFPVLPVLWGRSSRSFPRVLFPKFKKIDLASKGAAYLMERFSNFRQFGRYWFGFAAEVQNRSYPVKQ
jgi:hypothetical protein